MLLTLFLASLVAGIGLWFYKKKQVESLNEQLKDKDAIIAALTSHVESAKTEPIRQIREGGERNTRQPSSKPKQKSPKPQGNGQPREQPTGDKPKRRRRNYNSRGKQQ